MAKRRASAKGHRWKTGARLGVLFIGSTAIGGAAWADSFQFDNGIAGDYKLTLNYGVGMRMKNPDPALVNGPVDPLQPVLLPNPAGGQFVGFGHSGLSTTVNLDDGDRNFRKHDLINNRLSMYGEFASNYENYGLVASGDAFYDDVYVNRNSNDSPGTVNKYPDQGLHNDFTDSARYFSGHRARVLDAYVYGDWDFGEETHLNLRVGRQVVAWGESLFFSGVALSQGRADATRAFVPGAEIKEILLPTRQVGVQLTVNSNLTLLGYYHLEFKPSEIFPVGHFLSPADVVGPGAEFAYGSINPAALNGCPGLLGPLSPLCNLGGIGMPLINAPANINVTRGKDIEPKDSSWGVGFKYQLTPRTTMGLYRIRYADSNPTVQLNTGFAAFGSLAGIPITSQIVNQYVPVTYNVKYFGGIDMTALSLSGEVGPVNVAGELSYRQGVDTSVQADISLVRSPVYTRADMSQALVSAIYAANPKFFFDDMAAVGEMGYVYVNSVERPAAQNGIDLVGDGKRLFNDRSSFGYQLLLLGKKRNVMAGWDFTSNLSFAHQAVGNSPLAGAFGALYGEDDMRLGIGAGLQYLQNLEFGISYNMFFGDPDKLIDDSPLPQNPFADRDYVTFNIKYSL